VSDKARWDLRAALLILAVKLAADLVLGLAAAAILGPDMPVWTMVSLSTLIWIPVLLIIGAMARQREAGRLRWGTTAGWSKPLVAGIGVAAIVQSVLLSFLAGDVTTPLQEAMRTHVDLVAVAVFALLIAPLVEELFFRGYLYGALENAFGRTLAVIVVGLVFGMFHGVQYAGAPTALLAVTVMGLATTWVRAITGGLWPCIVLHLLYNLVGVSLLVLTFVPA